MKKVLQLSYSFCDNRLPPQTLSKVLKETGNYVETYYLLESNHSDQVISDFNECKSSTFKVKRKLTIIDKCKILFKLQTFIKNNNYDIIITHRFKPFMLALILSVFYRNIHYFAIFHGNGSFRKKSRIVFTRLLLHKNWHLITVSKSVERNILNTLGPTKAKLSVIYNSLDMSSIRSQQLSKKDARKELGLSQNKLVIGCTARLVKGKEIRHLIKAFSKINIHTPVQLAIIGDGPELKNLIEKTKKNNIEDQVIFCGYKNNAYQYATAFDLFVLPSSNEAFGLVILEAAAAKIPIIATTAGGIPEVAEGTEIILVPPQKSEALAREIEKICNLTSLERYQMGERLYQQLFNKFDISKLSHQYHELLELPIDLSSSEDKYANGSQK